MSSRFAQSYMEQKNIRFVVQIGSYSNYICKGYYSSPEFGYEESETRWSLLVHVYDGSDHENFIDVRLKRDDYVTEEQYVNAKTSIVSCTGFNVLKKEKKVLLTDSDEVRIFAVPKEHLKGYFGLKNFFYLPSDTLTLQCDLTVHESNVSPYENQEVFPGNSFSERSNFSEYYINSCLHEDNYDYFQWEIRNFSTYMYGGRTTGPEYQSNRIGGKWSLVACSTSDGYAEKSLDIRLMRREGYGNQLIKTKLSITNSSGEVLLSKVKNVFITSSREVQLLTFSEGEKQGWFGLNELMPGDTLTLRCDMVLLKQTDYSFSKREDYNKNIQTYGYSPSHLIPYIPIFSVMLAVSLYLGYSLILAIMEFLWFVTLEVFHAMKYFLAAVLVITFIFSWIKRRAESIKRKQKAIEMSKKLRDEKKALLFNQYLDYNAGNYSLNGFYYNGALNNYKQNYRSY